MTLDNRTSDYEAVVLHDHILTVIAKSQISSNETLSQVVEGLKDCIKDAGDNNERNILSSLISFLEAEKTTY